MERAKKESQRANWWRRQNEEAPDRQPRQRAGDACPSCGEGALAYDSLFVLLCPRCGYVAESGACT